MKLQQALEEQEIALLRFSNPRYTCVGNALTGGYIGHAVTVANTKVYNGFYDNNPSHALMHGPTFMGNALACSVSLKSIELFENQNYIKNGNKLNGRISKVAIFIYILL